MFSNNSNNKDVLEGIEKKQRRKIICDFYRGQVAEQIIKVSTVKSWAKVASGGSKGKTLDNNVLATEVAKKVNEKKKLN